MNVNDLKNLIRPICETAIQAGEVIKKYYQLKINVSFKESIGIISSNKYSLNSDKIVQYSPLLLHISLI